MRSTLKYNQKFSELTEEEKKLLEAAKLSIAEYVEHSSAINDINYATRDAHAKTYAVVTGKFKVDKNLPYHLDRFFDKEQYDIIVRFSNAHLKIKKYKKDIPAYGMSVKIKDGDRVIANYPLVNFPLFPLNSVSTFLKLFTSLNKIFLKNYFKFFSFSLQILKMLPSLLTVSFIKNVMLFLKKRNDSILSFNYHSVGVYRLGEHMIKIKLSPKIKDHSKTETPPQKTIKETLSSSDFVSEVYVQFCYNLKDQPVNLLNREWKSAPYFKIGEVILQKNSFLNPKEPEIEMLSFNPFDNIESLKPVGKIQKLRDEAYRVSFKTREKINNLLHGKADVTK
ncbi:catalase family protein [Chryseobacterium sp. CT-SW4]|uniref:catalase n=1 Tax=Chryseobacterium sp. SW-1 TaxID=3157343 RepID=UPI003B01B97E